jgi:hypothetical protein
VNDEEVKKRILARRASFVAAAIAGATGIACDSHPFACLEPPLATVMADASSSATPQPCLSEAVVPVATDAGAQIDADRVTVSFDAGPDPADANAPHPCLSVAVPHPTGTGTTAAPKRDAGVRPLVCLSEM